MKALGCQPVESTSPFKVLVSDVVNLHTPTSRGAEAAGKAEASNKITGEIYQIIHTTIGDITIWSYSVPRLVLAAGAASAVRLELEEGAALSLLVRTTGGAPPSG